MNRHIVPITALLAVIGLSQKATAADDGDLVEQSQNPVAKLISVPLETSADFDVGPSGEMAYVSLLKPVLPVAIGENWNLINRFIAPVIYLEGQDAITPPDQGFELGGREVFPGTDDEFGLGNLQYQAFFSPAKPGKIIWGAGPAFEFPTNTDAALGADTWSAGAAFVALSIQRPWVVGLLLQNIWDVEKESGEPDVNKATVQPILNYNLPNNWYLSATTTMSADWEAESGEEWTVPLGGGVGRLVRFGKQPVDFKLMGFWNAEKPEFGADYTVQFTVKFLFPKGQ